MLLLNNLVATNKKRKRIGRGGSRGSTSGRGHKGQKARTSGTVGMLFEGGQMPLHRRLPKRGFSNARFNVKYVPVNVDDLDNLFEDGSEITRAMLVAKGLVTSKNPIKLLARGSVTKKLIVYVDAWSKSAIEMLQKHGGDVQIESHTKER